MPRSEELPLLPRIAEGSLHRRLEKIRRRTSGPGRPHRCDAKEGHCGDGRDEAQKERVRSARRHFLPLREEKKDYKEPGRIRERFHARVLEGVAESQSPTEALVFKSQQCCPDTVSLDLDPLLHSGVVRFLEPFAENQGCPRGRWVSTLNR